MEIIYKAFDGTYFSNETECEDYEWHKQHEEGIDALIFYDEAGNILKDKLTEKTYSNAQRIIVPTQEAVEAIQALADYAGYLDYLNIDSVGIWEYHRDDIWNGCFEKAE